MRVLDDIEQAVIDAALLVAETQCDRNPPAESEALQAIEHGLRAVPRNEVLIREAMRLEAQLGNRDRANRRYQALVTLLARDDLEPDDATTELRNEIMGRDQPRRERPSIDPDGPSPEDPR